MGKRPGTGERETRIPRINTNWERALAAKERREQRVEGLPPEGQTDGLLYAEVLRCRGRVVRGDKCHPYSPLRNLPDTKSLGMAQFELYLR